MPRAHTPYREALQQGRLWTPFAEQGSLAGFWDVTDTATLTLVSGAVSALAEKSGRAADLSQATPASQPTYDDVNKLAVAASGQVLTAASFGITGAAARMVLFAGRATATDAMPVLWGGTGVAGQTFALRARDVNIHKPTISTWSTDLQMASNAEPTLSSSFIMAGGYTGTAVVGNVNGGTLESLTASINTGAGSATTLNVGTGLTAMPCDFHTLLIFSKYDFVLWQKAEAYLAWKLDSDVGTTGLVASLSVSHPYKNRPPLLGA